MDLTTVIVTHDPRIANQVDRVVAIRDGKISTETIRQVGQLEKVMAGKRSGEDSIPGAVEKPVGPIEGGEKHIHEEHPAEVTLQEFVVLDSAGRLQIPKELREQLGIGKRAYLETGENCIIIRPVEGQEGDQSRKLSLEEQIAMLFEQESVPQRKPGSLKRLKTARRK
jgi:bifunctional DNA-binding transcriptional regulator/antitoxin component of YhaV-PrlF toxin-antitoxin module